MFCQEAMLIKRSTEWRSGVSRGHIRRATSAEGPNWKGKELDRYCEAGRSSRKEV